MFVHVLCVGGGGVASCPPYQAECEWFSFTAANDSQMRM